MSLPLSLSRDISPPPRISKRRKPSGPVSPSSKKDDATIHALQDIGPTLAAVEAGRAKVENHLAYFESHLSKVRRDTEEHEPLISIDDWSALYDNCQHEHGNHFVVHQHNHPISGVHYDLRLQFSATSSLSFALPKGLPGNPNSRRLGRMAIETRVHNLWNHLIESASSRTGSLLIWDTGTYTILPRKAPSETAPSPQTTDSEPDSGVGPAIHRHSSAMIKKHENEKLIDAFQKHHIRLRLNGTRLPRDYTITLRLPSADQHGTPHKPKFARGRRRKSKPAMQPQPDSTDSETEQISSVDQRQAQQDLDTDEDEGALTCSTNAYPGSTNSIGSIHQRRWFMLLDRSSSGFVQDRESGIWVRRGSGEGKGFSTFLVRGREYEKSVVTGRLAAEVESDEGVEGFVGRAGWVGITR